MSRLVPVAREYRPVAVSVLAARWDGTPAGAAAVAGALGPGVTPSRLAGLLVATPDGDRPVPPGGWAVRHPAGFLLAFDHPTFLALYE